MARKTIGNQDNEIKMLPEFKPRKTFSKSLFNTRVTATVQGLPQQEKDYYFCVSLLNQLKDGKELQDAPTLRQICSFYCVEYEFLYGHEIIDGNYFNIQNTFRRLQSYYNLTLNDLLYKLARSFVKFDAIKSELNLNDKYPTVSVYKRTFITDKLLFEKSKFQGFH